MSMDPEEPPFARDFVIEDVDTTSISVRHRTDGHWWRFEVAEKNGRLQLVHAEHRTGHGPAGSITSLAIDAYDTATREARHRGMVD